MSLAGWVEILFVSLIAFVIIGPKDLPKVLFALARFIQTLRRLSSDVMAEFEVIRFLKDLEDKKADKNKTNNY